MDLKDIILVPSVQHTGTFFIVNFLKNFIPRSREIIFLLANVLTHCCIDPAPHSALLDQIATEWIPQNITPGNRFKEAYENNDLDKLREMLGPKWVEVEYLRNMASVIQPFLASLGYTRDKLRY